jgi:hypothetical protein
MLKFQEYRGPESFGLHSYGTLNILTATIFPQDEWGSPSTFFGEMHIIFSGVISMLSIMYILLFGIWFYRTGIS